MLNEISTARPQPLFTPVQRGKVQFPNRIIMAPLTGWRPSTRGNVPSDPHVEYSAQRASAGLIVGECTEISPDAYGWADTPGLWSPEQVRGWRAVTEAVHQGGGLIYAQLWHTGAMSHPEFFHGALPMSASAVNPEQESVTPSGRKPTVAPRPMSKNEIRRAVAEFGTAAKNAMEAGFDGVQIQANYLYLIAQFVNSATNLRQDEYGGSTVNRARFLFEITETMLEQVEPGRVGIKIGPMHLSGPFAANAHTLPDIEYVIKKLNDYDLAHLLLMGATTDFTGSPLEELAGDGMFQHFRPLYQGHLIANVEMTQDRGNRLIEAGIRDSIAFGPPHIANPDLPMPFLTPPPLHEVSWPPTFSA